MSAFSAILIQVANALPKFASFRLIKRGLLGLLGIHDQPATEMICNYQQDRCTYREVTGYLPAATRGSS